MPETCRVSWQNTILDTWCILLVIYRKTHTSYLHCTIVLRIWNAVAYQYLGHVPTSMLSNHEVLSVYQRLTKVKCSSRSFRSGRSWVFLRHDVGAQAILLNALLAFLWELAVQRLLWKIQSPIRRNVAGLSKVRVTLRSHFYQSLCTQSALTNDVSCQNWVY